MDSQQLNINEVVASCMTVCPGAGNDDRLLFRQWVSEAVKEIGPNRSWMKSCTLNPKDGSFRKPKDFVCPIDLALYDSAGGQLNFNFIADSTGRIQVDRFVIRDNIVNGSTVGRIDLSEDAYYFHLGTNGTAVDSMKLSYFAMPVDRDGMPYVPEDNLTAYKMFCRWHWAMRRNDNQSEIDINYSIWVKERNKARGRNKMPSMFHGKEIFKRYMSMISAPKF